MSTHRQPAVDSSYNPNPCPDLLELSRTRTFMAVWTAPIFCGFVVILALFVPLASGRSSDSQLTVILPWIPMSFLFAAIPVSLLIKTTRRLQEELKELRGELSEARNAQAQAP